MKTGRHTKAGAISFLENHLSDTNWGFTVNQKTNTITVLDQDECATALLTPSTVRMMAIALGVIEED